ncbi:tetratricopeptide repeat protein [Elongatibacter sediminis]|uniref:Tetratricopeptide repeat protein n=1 Tax=Elongatibacter sediminis TaxID=3119006 RepID=A0AAW9RCH7_9GAMM
MNIDTLEKMIADGKDGAMLRLTLARLLAADQRLDEAAAHLQQAVELEADYTAAWKELGRVHAERGDDAAAESAWLRGTEVAQANGDKQAEREMGVFLKRLRRRRES